jgi:DNA-binding transcriptional LysR family regulator
MHLDAIETFLDLIESRSFRTTAERLGITQSTVSARVKALEQSLGSQLFLRGRSGARPTAAGRRFEDHARSMKASWGLARQELGALDRFKGSLRIAAQVSFADTLLSEWMDAISAAIPRIALHVEADYSPQMVVDLAFGNLDIGLVYAPRFVPEIQYRQLMTQSFKLVSSTAARLADIEPQSYIRPGYTPIIEKAHSELLPELSRPRMSVGLDVLTVERLRRRGGAGYVPSYIAQRLSAEGIAREVIDAPAIEQPVFAATRIRRKLDPNVSRALAILDAIIREGDYGTLEHHS